MAFTEDMTAFYADFGIASTLQGGSTGGVTVIFDRAYSEQFGIAGTRPVARVVATAVAAGDIEKTLTISGTAYTIKGREPIDDGTEVLLHLQAP